MTDVLHSIREGRLLRLTLNRPDKRNALNAALCRALVTALEDAARDPAVGAILLTADGKAFCAGMDLAEIEPGADAEEINAVHEQLFTVGARLTKPLIAAVHGAALAGGTGLVANCHIVVAAPGATFGLTEIRLGLWPFLVYRAVAAALGDRRTMELSLTGRIFDAAEARQIGLVHEVVDAPQERALGNRPGSRRNPVPLPSSREWPSSIGYAGWTGSKPAPSPARCGIRYLPGKISARGFAPSGRNGLPGGRQSGNRMPENFRATRLLRICDTRSCGVASRDTQCWGQGALLLRRARLV